MYINRANAFVLPICLTTGITWAPWRPLIPECQSLTFKSDEWPPNKFTEWLSKIKNHLLAFIHQIDTTRHLRDKTAVVSYNYHDKLIPGYAVIVCTVYALKNAFQK